MSIRTSSWLLLVGVMIFATLMFNAAGPAYATANVYVSPSQLFVGVGQNFNVDIAVSNVQNLYGWEFTLNWSSTFLGAVNVAEGPFLRSLNQTFFSSSINNTLGHMIVDCTLLGDVGSVNGSGVLATLAFNVKAAGQSILDLYNATLLDSSYPDPQIIACSLTGGYWVSSQHEVAVTAVTFSPSAVLPGQTVTVNVSVADEGDYVEDFNVTAFVDSQVIGEQTVHLNSGSSTVLFFNWNTTGFGKGEYVISCYASIVPGEVDMADNNRTSSDTVTILVSAHDVAVTGVKASKIVVGQGFCMFINVTVKNFGTYSETFNTITYANDTAIHADAVSLASGQGAELVLLWNTSSFLMSKYLIRSYAEPVSLETDVSDNTDTFGLVTIAKRGDITSVTPNVPDGKVDMRDVAAVARPFGMRPGGSLWNGNADITGITLGLPDNVINMRDVSWVAINFGK